MTTIHIISILVLLLHLRRLSINAVSCVSVPNCSPVVQLVTSTFHLFWSEVTVSVTVGQMFFECLGEKKQENTKLLVEEKRLNVIP